MEHTQEEAHTAPCPIGRLLRLYSWRYETQYNDTLHNDVQNNGTKLTGLLCDSQEKLLSDTQHNNAVYYTVCSYAECCVLFILMLSVLMLNVIMMSVVAPYSQHFIFSVN